MLGYILLLVALALYFNKSYRYLSVFLYISFMLGYGGGFGLWNDQVLGVKTMDLALIYTFAINGFLLVTWQNPFRPFKGHKHFWLISYMVLVVLCSVLVCTLWLYALPDSAGRTFIPADTLAAHPCQSEALGASAHHGAVLMGDTGYECALYPADCRGAAADALCT